MAIWRLITHHEKPGEMLETYRKKSCIAMGWGAIGDLNLLRPASHDAIKVAIQKVPSLNVFTGANSPGVGGRCLWGFWQEMNPGDLVILSVGNGPLKDVVKIGKYGWISPGLDGYTYNHYREVEWQNKLNGEELWSKYYQTHVFVPPWNIRWALIRLS